MVATTTRAGFTRKPLTTRPAQLTLPTPLGLTSLLWAKSWLSSERFPSKMMPPSLLFPFSAEATRIIMRIMIVTMTKIISSSGMQIHSSKPTNFRRRLKQIPMSQCTLREEASLSLTKEMKTTTLPSASWTILENIRELTSD